MRKKLGFLEAGTNGLCSTCSYLETLQPETIEQINQQAEIKAEVDAILLTTETAPNLNIIRRIEIVTAECAFGMNIFKDLFSGVRNVVGGRSEAVQKTMRESRRTARVRISAFRRVRIHVEGSINQKVRMRDHD